MSIDMSLNQRMEAWYLGHAVPIAARRLVTIQPHAHILVPIVMAGEETDLWMVGIGQMGTPARIRYVADPRYRDDQYSRIISWLNPIIDRYFSWCLANNTYPQLWLSSSAGARLIDILSDRLRSAQHPDAQRLGHLLAYPGQRLHHDGQLTLMTATGALRRHVATGQQPGEDEHLGTVLTWIDPPPGVRIQEAVASAEREPSGIRTDPALDWEILKDVIRHNKARRANAPSSVLEAHAHTIRVKLEPTVQRIYGDIQRAISYLDAWPYPDLPDLSRYEEREIREFAAHMGHVNKGGHITMRDKPKAATLAITKREDAVDLLEAVVRCGDPVARAGARLDGHIITGRIENLLRTPVTKRKDQVEFDLVCTQRTLRVRPRDDLYWADDPRVGIEVVSYQRQGGQTRLHVLLTSGKKLVKADGPHLFGPLANGLFLAFTTQRPDWGRLPRDLRHLTTVLETPPWTHDGTSLPSLSPVPGPIPTNLLQAVEALR